jgi:uncharacterized protein YkwD
MAPRHRRPPVAVLVAAVLGLGLGGCVAVEVPVSDSSPAPQSPPPADGSSAEDQMARAIFDRVNAERSERGLAPVEWNDALAEVARDWSREMAASGRLEHQDVRDLLPREELGGLNGIGENVFRATGPVPAGTVHAGWMRSDDHRVNVLDPGWDRLGVGVHCADDGSVWATQEFGRTAGSDRPAPSSETPAQDPIVHPEDDGPGCR